MLTFYINTMGMLNVLHVYLDAGAAYMFATFAPVTLWNGTGSQLASCRIQENLYFGIRDVGGLTGEMAVTSSDGSLPDLETCGSNSFEDR